MPKQNPYKKPNYVSTPSSSSDQPSNSSLPRSYSTYSHSGYNISSKILSILLPIIAFIIGQIVLYVLYIINGTVLLVDIVFPEIPILVLYISSGCGVISIIHIIIRSWKWADDDGLGYCWAYIIISCLFFAIIPVIAGFLGIIISIGIAWCIEEAEEERIPWVIAIPAVIFAIFVGITIWIGVSNNKTYIITFDLQGGYGEDQSVEVKYNNDMPEAAIPYRVGYSFLGFFDAPIDSEYGEEQNNIICYYDSNMESVTKWDKKEDAVLYAHWQAKEYTVILDSQGGSGGSSNIIATYDQEMPYAEEPTLAGYIFLGYYTEVNGDGVCYYNSYMASQRNWDIDSDFTLYAFWEVSPIFATPSNGNLINIENTVTVTISVRRGSGNYSYEITNNYSGIACSLSGNTLTVTRTAYSVSGEIIIFVRDNVTGATTSCSIRYSTASEPSQSDEETDGGGGSCVAKGTEILLSNGQSVPIEDLSVGDKILTFDHISGEYVEAEIAFTYYANSIVDRVMLNFSKGVDLEILNTGHGLYDLTLDKYVLVTPNNVNEYVGHSFAYTYFNEGDIILSEVILLDYLVDSVLVERYDIVTENNLNHIANGILACSDTLVSVSNIYKFDKLLCDTEQLAEDIERYGLYSYEEWSEYVSEEEFEAFNGAYFKIAVEKGLLTMDELYALIKDLRTQWD